LTPEEKKEFEDLKTDNMLTKRDIHTIAESVADIASNVKKMVELKHSIELMDQRQEARHQQLKEADKLNRQEIDIIRQKQEQGIPPRTLKGLLIYGAFTIIGFGTWITIFTFAIDKYLEANISSQNEKNKKYDSYETKIQYNENQINYVKGRLKRDEP
jgi:hypothetical protein